MEKETYLSGSLKVKPTQKKTIRSLTVDGDDWYSRADFLSHIDSVVKKYPAMTYSMIKELKEIK